MRIPRADGVSLPACNQVSCMIVFENRSLNVLHCLIKLIFLYSRAGVVLLDLRSGALALLKGEVGVTFFFVFRRKLMFRCYGLIC